MGLVSGLVQIINAESFKIDYTVKISESKIIALEWSPHNLDVFATGSADGGVRIVDKKTGKITKLEHHKNRVRVVAWN